MTSPTSLIVYRPSLTHNGTACSPDTRSKYTWNNKTSPSFESKKSRRYTLLIDKSHHHVSFCIRLLPLLHLRFCSYAEKRPLNGSGLPPIVTPVEAEATPTSARRSARCKKSTVTKLHHSKSLIQLSVLNVIRQGRQTFERHVHCVERCAAETVRRIANTRGTVTE